MTTLPASRPLEGVRVLDLSRLLPGAYCTLVLADLGAGVVKVEEPQTGDLVRTIPPFVDGASVYYRALNRNKRGITLDLRASEARSVLDRLLASADVVVESFRPHTARRLGVSAAQLHARHSRLVHCSLTGFGQAGPYSERAAHDLNFVALAGLLEVDQPRDARKPEGGRREAGGGIQQTEGGRRRAPGLLVADIGSAWAAATSICAALFERERTGVGRAIDISIHDVAVSWLTFPAAAKLAATGAGHPVAFPVANDQACYNIYLTADGREIALAAIEGKFWRTFCERCGHPELVPQQFVPGVQDDLRQRVADLFRSRTAAEWLDLFADTDVCLTRINSIGDAVADPHLVRRGTVVSHGPSTYIRTPIAFGEASPEDGPSYRSPVVDAPALGQHTDEVMREVGFDEAAIADLRGRRII